MDFAASEAKKRGQSFPETAVNLRRERPGTNQPCPMRPTSAGRSDPGFVPGTPVDFAGTITTATDSYAISGVNVNAGNNKIILYTDKMPGQVTQVTGSSFPMYRE